MDRDKDRNLPANLCWATHRENEAHKQEHGTAPVGEKNGAALLQAGDIPAIFQAYLVGDAPTVALAFGVDRSCIYEILKRRTWAHVEIDPSTVRAAAQRALQNRSRQGGVHP